MAIKPYLEDRKEHWQSICASIRPTDSSNGTEGAPRASEQPGPREAQGSKESRHATSPVRRNQKYKVIDEALRKMAESLPRTQEEVFQSLEGRHLVIPPGRAFYDRARMDRGFRRDAAAARAALEAGPEEVVVVTTLGNLLEVDCIPL